MDVVLLEIKQNAVQLYRGQGWQVSKICELLHCAGEALMPMSLQITQAACSSISAQSSVKISFMAYAMLLGRAAWPQWSSCWTQEQILMSLILTASRLCSWQLVVSRCNFLLRVRSACNGMLPAGCKIALNPAQCANIVVVITMLGVTRIVLATLQAGESI